MPATSLMGTVTMVVAATGAGLLVAAVVATAVTLWRRRHDEPLFAGVAQPAAIELVTSVDEDPDAFWAAAAALPARRREDVRRREDTRHDAVPRSSRRRERLGPAASRPGRAAAGTGVIVALTMGLVADRRGGRGDRRSRTAH